MSTNSLDAVRCWILYYSSLLEWMYHWNLALIFVFNFAGFWFFHIWYFPSNSVCLCLYINLACLYHSQHDTFNIWLYWNKVAKWSSIPSNFMNYCSPYCPLFMLLSKIFPGGRLYILYIVSCSYTGSEKYP